MHTIPLPDTPIAELNSLWYPRAMTDLGYFIGFNRVSGIGPAKLQRLLEHFGDLSTVWTAGAFELREAGLDKRALENLPPCPTDAESRCRG